MAQDTPAWHRNLVLYEVYVRNHGPNGTFADVEADLPRIRSMGVDVVWLMPIHPIGQVGKKGSLGCPYSIADYRGVNPEYGTRADLQRLIERAHDLDLKVMIDVVYNHTSHDSLLVTEHPDWFHQDENGVPVTTVPAWSDVIDLKHPNKALSAYLIETLCQWARGGGDSTTGVDGFRCDVASLLPAAFWADARRAVAAVKPGVIWLAESVHAGFVESRRAAGLSGLSDSELYESFDMTYNYDIGALWEAAVEGRAPVSRYLEMLRFQDAMYPANYVKMRFVENHDRKRIMALAPSEEQALAWTAFEAFNKGAFLIYAGQESAATHTPSLFDVDKIAWSSALGYGEGGFALQPFLTRLAQLKKDPAQQSGRFALLAAEPAIQAAWQGAPQKLRVPRSQGGGGLYGVFNVGAAKGKVAVRLPDGTYEDALSGESVVVRSGGTQPHGNLTLPRAAVILRYETEIDLKPFHALLLDG